VTAGICSTIRHLCWQQGTGFRSVPTAPDWIGIFFGYGLDYKAALKSLTTISGDIPLPRKTVMGAWYSRNWPYTQDEFQTDRGAVSQE